MATLQELTHQQIDEAIRAGAERNVPATVTIRAGKSWENLQSRLLALRNEHLLIAKPVADGGSGGREFEPADKIGLSFKLKHHKHIFTATVAGHEPLDTQEARDLALSVCWPTRMHRLQRRAFLRVNVPASRIVRASFWLGGRDTEPAGTSADRPVWSGRVTNLSAGGFQLVTRDEPLDALEVGETVGVRLAFGAARDAVYADAQFRHIAEENGRNVMGFQFLGLPHSPEGRETLQAITTKVGELQRMDSARARRRGAS